MPIESPFLTNASNTSSQKLSPSIITFFDSGCLFGSNVVKVLIPYVFFAIRDVIEWGNNPNKHAPLITLIWGLLGTIIYKKIKNNE